MFIRETKVPKEEGMRLEALYSASRDWDSGLSIELRTYQKEALDNIEKAFGKTNRVIVSIPTGGGKTLIFNTYSLKKGYRTLMVAHRDELLQQAIDKYVMLGGDYSKTGIIGAGFWKEGHYTVASIQTLHRNLGRINGKDYDLVIWDECHHLPARTYREVWEKLLATNPSIRMLGVTATPFRYDQQNLQEFFEEMAYAIDILELIRLGYLVPIKGKLVPLPVDMDDVKLSSNEFGEEDFSLKSIATVFNTKDVNSFIVKKWFELGENRKTIFYLPSLAQAYELARLFSEAGVPSAYIDGNMSMEQRREILRLFKQGEIRIITNMNILTEGFDDPYVECIGIVRPTKSLTLYAQIVGRGLRIAPNKKDCLILDFTGISKKHTVVGLPELFGIDREAYIEAGGEISVGGVKEEGKEEPVLKIYLGEGDVSEFTFDGQEASLYATRLGDNIIVSCGLNGKALYLEPEGNLYNLYIIEKDPVARRGTQRLLKKGLTEDYAWTVLTAVWKKEMDDFMLSYRDRAMKQGLTEKQRAFILDSIMDGKIMATDLPKPLAELSKLDATNIIAYIIAKPHQEELCF